MRNHITQTRRTIAASLLLLALSGAPPQEVEVLEVPAVKIDVEEQRRTANKVEREVYLWEHVVEAVAKKTGITNRALAETVAQAIEDASSESKLDPWLLCSLIRVESSGNPNIVSPVGAIGLTQIMPATGRQIAASLGIENYSRKVLYDPTLNVRMGAFYLRSLLDQFDGNLHTALAAYNWGPGYIAKRISRHEPLPVQYPSKILKYVREPSWVEARS